VRVLPSLDVDCLMFPLPPFAFNKSVSIRVHPW
jgi:hypothetical protein